jgi:hypothetical protein
MSDAVFIGSETPWLTVDCVRSLAAATAVVGVVSGPADPMVRLFHAAGVAELLPDSAPPMAAITAAISLGDRGLEPPTTPTVTVTGARGAPGRTEIALALGWALGHGTLVAELDFGAPSLGLRAGIAPRPESAGPVAEFGPVSLLLPPVGGGPLSSSITARVIEAASTRYQRLILDSGPSADRLRGETVVVCDPTPVGIVRCASLLAGWTSAPPLLIVNRADGCTDLALVRHATGLEPAAVVPRSAVPHPGEPPPFEIVGALETVTDRLRSPQDSAA